MSQERHGSVPLLQRLLLTESRSVGRAAVVLLGLLVWLLVLFWYMQPAALHLQSTAIAREFHGVYRAEVLDGREATFSGWESRLPLAARSTGPALLTLQMTTPQGVEQRPLKVWSSHSTPATFAVAAGWRSYRLLLPGHHRISGQQWLNLSTVATSYERDSRTVGVALAQVSLSPRGLHHPDQRDAMQLLVLLVLGTLLLHRLRVAVPVGILLSGGVLAASRTLVNTSNSAAAIGISLVAVYTLISMTGLLFRHNRLWLRYWLMLLGVGLFAILGYPAPFDTVILTLHMLGVLAATLGVLCYAGFGVTWFLRSYRLAPALPLFTPVIGFAVLAAVGHALGYLPIGTDQTAWTIIVLCTLLNGLAWRRGARPTLNHTHWWAVAVGMVALIVALFPLYQVGYLTTLGNTIDALSYLTRAEYLQTQGLMLHPSLDYVKPVRGWIEFSTLVGLRQGDTFLLALLSSLLNLRPHLIFPVVMAVWYALVPVGTFVLARYELRLHRLIALVASLLAASQPLLHFTILDTFLSQAGGMALWTFALVAALAALRSGGVRTIMLAGLLLAALASVYYAYLVYLVPIPMIVALYEWLKRSRGAAHAATGRRCIWSTFAILAGRGMGIGVAALLTMPVVWLLVFIQWKFFADVMRSASSNEFTLATKGNIFVYPHIAEVFGLINHIGGEQGEGLTQIPLLFANTLLLLALALVVYALVRSTWQQRVTVLATIALLGLGLLHQRFWIDHGRGYPYGYFKLITVANPLLVLLFVAGAMSLWYDTRGMARVNRRPVRLALFALVYLFVLIAGFHLLTTATHFTSERHAATRGTLEVEQAAALVPEDEPLLVVDVGNGLWTMYMLMHPSMYYREPSPGYGVGTQPQSPQMLRYAVVARSSYAVVSPPHQHEPWFWPWSREVIWEGEEYLLVRRTDTEIIADMPLMTGGVLLPLATPAEIVVTNEQVEIAESILDKDSTLHQTLQGEPGHLELSLYSPFGGILTIEQGTEQYTLLLAPGFQTHRIVTDKGVSLTLHQSSPSVMPMLPVNSGYLAGVRVVGVSTTHTNAP